MSLTANFDFCVELGLAPLKAIFHLALKNEDLFPHNVGPFERTYSGLQFDISAQLIDDDSNPADLELADDKHIRFFIPFVLTAEIPDAPDPSLSRVTLQATCTVPGALATWQVDGSDQLGVDFSGVTPADVTVPSITGLPQLDASRFKAAIDTQYQALPSHTFTLGTDVLVIYDGNLDTSLSPPNNATPSQIQAAVETHDGTRYLKVTLPLHADVPQALGFSEYGNAVFFREVAEDDTSVSVVMGSEPADPTLATVITFEGSSPAAGIVASQLMPLLLAQLGAFGTITEPWFTEASAKTVMAAEIASYAAARRYPMYTPQSGDPDVPLSTPVGFLLPSAGVLAVLMNRRDSSVADFAPDAFIGASQVALAVGRARLDEMTQDAMNTQFPGVNNGGAEVRTKEGTATLYTLTVTPSDAGTHDQSAGHLWAEGTAEVHIDCWPDPDVSFHGAIHLNVKVTETDTECTMEVQPTVSDFDASESCCDVFIDILIPVVGIVMLIVVETLIDKVGGELATQFSDQQARDIQAIPPFVVGVAELQACLEDLITSSQGLVFPGKLRIRRDGRSFEDLADSGNLPRP
jgi:hypothetical protein